MLPVGGGSSISAVLLEGGVQAGSLGSMWGLFLCTITVPLLVACPFHGRGNRLSTVMELPGSLGQGAMSPWIHSPCPNVGCLWGLVNLPVLKTPPLAGLCVSFFLPSALTTLGLPRTPVCCGPCHVLVPVPARASASPSPRQQGKRYFRKVGAGGGRPRKPWGPSSCLLQGFSSEGGPRAGMGVLVPCLGVGFLPLPERCPPQLHLLL